MVHLRTVLNNFAEKWSFSGFLNHDEPGVTFQIVLFYVRQILLVFREKLVFLPFVWVWEFDTLPRLWSHICDGHRRRVYCVLQVL